MTMRIRHVAGTDGKMKPEYVFSTPTTMTNDEIAESCKTAKQIGMSSKMSLPISVVERLLRESNELRNQDPAVREFARG
jgi:hypothetical protein